MKYKHLFFDLDHTLWDFETNEQETLQELYHHHALESRGVPTFEEFSTSYTGHNERLWDRFRKGFITRNDLRYKRFRLTLLDFKIGDEALNLALSDQFLAILPNKKRLFPETVETLNYLAAKQYPMHMITNGFEETQLLKMKNSGIDHFFTHVITSEVAGSLKPYREIFDYAMMKAGTTAAESIMIGDAMELDIKGAHGVGMDQVYFNPAKPAADFLPTFSISHLKELRDIL
ncbi:YjjG family noncanonical pyrimidine nucleotidase [Chitinophaga nivalis]|uniref:YjjG family noncanonical pyrimidine nucleotidase n=1 Tax=Chitinophaga nivalis TaxID=2991709 RepID=A0ABT3IV26_9BACT|nr:YjjG family noncanonical pyrimidine nucleotidase [Chitinophaga nivalis]MCW3462487.1 YjjG family noncanonical pyrimidine nucleotidase [Chitinophaga nivalis]MCW3487822.1 YjjG family noncanonical pyrimidine nucleotidase [Chitinophaga nivalis]